MKTAFPYAEKLMSLLSGSPEVKVLLEREKRQAADAEKQARIDCLARIKTLYLAELKTKQKLDAALSAVTDEQTKANELRSKAAIAYTAHTEAQRKRGQAAAELNQIHGEGVVSQTLYRLDRLIKKTESQINDLELRKSSFPRDGDGRLTFQPVSPNVGLNQQVLKQRLEMFQKLYTKAKEFVNSEMAPSEIKELCESICKAIGQPIQTPEAQA